MFVGLMLSIASAWIAAVFVENATAYSLSRSNGKWTVAINSPIAAVSIESRTHPPANWSPAQATGIPDTLSPGDRSSAWAAMTSNGSPEWLQLDFGGDYDTGAIEVYENLSPGAITRITSVDANGTETEIWKGDELVLNDRPVPYSRTIVNNRLIHKIRLYIGRKEILGWNEVDAVALIDGSGNTHWAISATASSWYGQGNASTAGGDPSSILPPWAKVPIPDGNPNEINAAQLIANIEARGWPMVCLYNIEHGPDNALANLNGPYYSGQSWSYPSPTISHKVRWPIRPIWTGLLVDTIVLAFLAYLLWVVLVIPRRFIREVRRVKNGCCIQCGYDLGYNLQNGCPECGWRRT